MRVWIQSNTALRSDKVWADYATALEAHMNEIKRIGTEIRVEGVEKMERNVEGSALHRHLNVRGVLECGMQAQKEGYDAFVMVGMGTAGYDELRDMLTVPVVYAESVAWNFAVWQYRRFALIGHNSTVYFRRVEQIRVHGSQSLFVPGDYCEFSDKDILEAFRNPGPVVDAFERSTSRAVRDGAMVLVPDFNLLTDLLIAAGVKAFHGVPIMDVGGLALKAAELLVDARRAGILAGTLERS